MNLRSSLGATAILLTAVAAADAQTIRPEPLAGGSIAIGVVSGTGYYTVEPEGYRVVITLTKGTERPIRFETVLTDGQSMILSAPRELGAESEVMTITREGDELVVTGP
jgi:hypothetical protein